MRTSGIVALAALALTSFAPVSAGPSAAKGKPEVYALEIKKEEPGRDEQFATQEGVVLKLFIPQPGKFIIGVDEKASTLTSFVDDRKTDLSKGKKESAFKQGWLSPFSEVTKDGQGVKLDVRSSQVPAAGASRINLKASVALRTGENEKKQELKDVSLKDSKVTLAGMPMTIKQGKDQAWGDYKMSVTVTSNRPQDCVRQLAFLGPDGKEIKSGVISRSSFSFGAGGHFDVTYGLEKPVDKATIKAAYFEKVEVVNVPLEMEIGVGF